MSGIYRLDHLKAQRESAGLSVDDLARRAVMNTFNLQQIEEGRACEPLEAQRIADALGVTLEDLGAAAMR